MKKIIYLCFVFSGVLLLTGCGNSKVLTCTKDGKDLLQYGKVDIIDKISYNNGTNQLGNLTYAINIDLANDTNLTDASKKEVVLKMKERFEKLCNEYTKVETCTVRTDTPYSIKIQVVGQRDIIDSKTANFTNLEEIKLYYEGQDYTCKEE